jgi:hypothetical protein
LSAFRDFMPEARFLEDAPYGVSQDMPLGGQGNIDQTRQMLQQLMALSGNPDAMGPDAPPQTPTPRSRWLQPAAPQPPQAPDAFSTEENPKPPSAVANDPNAGLGMALKARTARMKAIQQWRVQDDNAILNDPRVQRTLRSVAQLTGDLEHLVQQQQNRMDDLRLQIAHVMGAVMRDPNDAAQLRKHLPKLRELLSTIQAGEPGRGTLQKIGLAKAELDYAGISEPPAATFMLP